MPDPLSSSAEGDDPNIADARWVVRDAPPAPSSGATNRSEVRVGADEEYAVGALDAPTDLNFPTVQDPERRGYLPGGTRRRSQPRKASRHEVDPAQEVQETWTRWAEWKSTLSLLGIALLATICLVLAAIEWEYYGAALSFLIGGVLVMLALSYPIFVTLERPVRLIPEQALRDYFHALSIRYPHYRRMWLLLSTSARRTKPCSTFEEFQNYWQAKLVELRGGRPQRSNLLKFEVTNFDKSMGMNWWATRS